jgi:hypothetical protein
MLMKYLIMFRIAEPLVFTEDALKINDDSGIVQSNNGMILMSLNIVALYAGSYVATALGKATCLSGITPQDSTAV